MDFIRNGTFKKGTARNSETGESKPLDGLGASLRNYAPEEVDDPYGPYWDTALYGSARADYIAFKLKVGSTTYTTSGITDIYAHDGDDLVDLTSSTADYDVAVFIDAGNGADTVWAGPHNDIVVGRFGTDSLWGGRGDDRIDGGDRIYEGSDTEVDTLHGYDGNDTIYGSNGDIISGGAGDDEILVRDDYYEGDGILSGSIDGGSQGEEGEDVFVWGNTYLGLGGYPSATLTGVEVIRLPWDGWGGGTIFAADPGTAVTFDFSGVRFENVYAIDGSEQGDAITGPADTNIGEGTLDISGYGGSDTLTGGGSSEDLDGGLGEDIIRGGGGSDVVFGGTDQDDFPLGDAAPDQLYGGSGPDSFEFVGEFGDESETPGDGETIYDFEQGEDDITFLFYYDDDVELDFDVMQARGLITQANAEYIKIDLTEFGGSNLFVNGTVAQFDENDFIFFSSS